MPESRLIASFSPERRLSGRSIWVTSPVITAFDSNPRRVRNIFICSVVVFCASSRITNASFSVRPRAPGDQNGVLKDVPQIDARIGAQRDCRAADVLRADRGAAAGHPVELLDQAAGDADPVLGPEDGQLVAPDVELGPRLALDQ